MSEFNFLELVLNASMFVKGIMFILLAMSIASWAVIFSKMASFSRTRYGLKKFEGEFTEDFNKLLDVLTHYRDSTLGVARLLRAGMREHMRMTDGNHIEPNITLNTTERAMQVIYNQEYAKMGQGLAFLASVGSLSVYIGLLGTVWGVMHAFSSMGGSQNITLAMVAPGIAEALIATAIGLIAAIPAAYAHNRFKSRLTEIAGIYHTYAEAFLAMTARRLLERQ